ncbi:MAG TPA: hypothetical protein VHX66_05715 [Solirubrobacteraceae bacterium]|jgi:hypothetical protein|nr:hypothetical protein [Solirubrobacteraceae bacterium]
MRKRLAVLLCVLAPVLVAAAASPAGGVAATACSPAAIHHGPPPAWTGAAFGPSTGGHVPPFAVSGHAAAAAFFFAPTLRAGNPSNPANKVLWVVRYARDGSPLRISGRYGANTAVTAKSSWPDNSSPGEIYPSYVNLPRAGCWELTLRWSSHQARIDVEVHPRAH